MVDKTFLVHPLMKYHFLSTLQQLKLYCFFLFQQGLLLCDYKTCEQLTLLFASNSQSDLPCKERILVESPKRSTICFHVSNAVCLITTHTSAIF